MIYTCGQYYSSTEKWNPNLCYNMGKPGEHYANWNKPGTKEQQPYNFI